MLQTQCYGSQVSRLRIADRQTARPNDYPRASGNKPTDYTWLPTRASGNNLLFHSFSFWLFVPLVVVVLLCKLLYLHQVQFTICPAKHSSVREHLRTTCYFCISYDVNF